MNHFPVRNPIFKVTIARRSPNDKFVTVGLPDADTNANLIIFDFKFVPLYPGPTNPNLSGGSAGDAKRLQLLITCWGYVNSNQVPKAIEQITLNDMKGFQDWTCTVCKPALEAAASAGPVPM